MTTSPCHSSSPCPTTTSIHFTTTTVHPHTEQQQQQQQCQPQPQLLQHIFHRLAPRWQQKQKQQWQGSLQRTCAGHVPRPHHCAAAFVSLTRHGCTATTLRQERCTATTAAVSYDHSPLVHHAAAPGLTEDGRHLRSPGGVRTAHVLAVHQPASPLTRPCPTTVQLIQCRVPERLLPCSLRLKRLTPPPSRASFHTPVLFWKSCWGN